MEIKYYIWGTGNNAKKICNSYKENIEKMSVVAFIDNDFSKIGSYFEGKMIIPFKEIAYDTKVKKVIIISVADNHDIIKQINEVNNETILVIQEGENFIRLFDRMEAINSLDNYNKLTLRGKNCLITGGTSGIGEAIAYKMLLEGANVVVIGRNKNKIALLSQKYPLIKSYCWDLTEIEGIESKIQDIVDLFGGEIDILINSAGILLENDFSVDFFSVQLDEWDEVFDVNLKALFYMSQIISKRMIKNNIHGHIVNISSEMGIRPVSTPYGLSKWGVTGLTKGLGKILAPYGIVVNGVAPGAITTGMMHWKEDDLLYRKSHANKRFGMPYEIAELVCFLASDKASNIVGEIIVSDGGSSLR